MTQNGYVPASNLVTVQSGIQLSRPTANAWTAMLHEGSRTGHRLGIATPAGGYRSYAVQVDMRAHPSRYNLNPKSKAGIAAPGRSNHGYGTCVDIVGDLTWAIANAARWGFSRPFGKNDPNHFLHNGVTAITGSVSDITIHPEENTDMSFRLLNRGGHWWGIVISPFSILEIDSATDPAEYYASYYIHGDGKTDQSRRLAPAEIEISENDLRIEYVQLKKRIAAANAAGLGGTHGASGTFPTPTEIATEVIRQQKLPGN